MLGWVLDHFIILYYIYLYLLSLLARSHFILSVQTTLGTVDKSFIAILLTPLHCPILAALPSLSNRQLPPV